ncbi:MBL fold metallo-hydrolase [Gracilimonas sp.]|uniref:MBL fold metallo-hydrolase n=1 Tax=Gracilimonas sp. TaxID=1974203 RepID=UPI0025C4D708|nr:MBL fold metallo-hydrolase [Gracilimonas sp.]
MESDKTSQQFITVLGIAQDAGFPQADCEKEHCKQYWDGRVEKRHVVSLGLSDQTTGQNWMFEATPDFTYQLHQLKSTSAIDDLSGIFLTHAHIGHYTGLMYLGHEVMGASGVPVYTMPRMKSYLKKNGPWSQLVSMNNIDLQQQKADSTIQISPNILVTPFRVPHRDEYSETVGYRINSENTSILFIPDINKWHVWERDIIEEVSKVDVALLDGTFYDANELPGRDMSEIPHPYVEESIKLFNNLPASEKEKIMFLHFNHTNPLILDGPERREVENLGFQVASEGQIIPLN